MRDEIWDIQKDVSKQIHDDRVAKMPDRIAYAIKQFEANNIEYVLKNEATGHFHVRRKSDDRLFNFYANTGKIMGQESKRGIYQLIKMLKFDGLKAIAAEVDADRDGVN